MNFAGIWNIHKMEMWDEDYFNMEVQAYIYVNENGGGGFRFGLVSCGLHGKVVDYAGQERFEFTFTGSDEFDPISGSGWITLKDKDKIEGEFRFHLGDSSTFLARKARERSLK